MPISKKPRSKPALRTSTKTSALAALPDRRAMEGFLAIAGNRGGDATAKAQDVIYDAWERTSSRSRIALARKALGISPLCADAYVLLAEEARSLEEARDYYAKGVEAGELALGPRGFKRYAGHFWGFLETRPYMRARAGLASTLLQLGEIDSALAHYCDMLKLNPNDNQGIRYVLAGCLLRQDNDSALKELLAAYADGSASWLYTRALVAFRESGDSDEQAAALVRGAWSANEHVPAILAGTKPPVISDDGYVTMGGPDEATDYVRECGPAWHRTPGAVAWLTKLAAILGPTQRTRLADHLSRELDCSSPPLEIEWKPLPVGLWTPPAVFVEAGNLLLQAFTDDGVPTWEISKKTGKRGEWDIIAKGTADSFEAAKAAALFEAAASWKP
jgi:tetratricopeptide (TPR) repeat protein